MTSSADYDGPSVTQALDALSTEMLPHGRLLTLQRIMSKTWQAGWIDGFNSHGDDFESANPYSVCSCACSSEMHVGEIGCPCALPGESPCVIASVDGDPS